MILEYFGNTLDPNKWEDICDTCYRIRYQNDHYRKIPANYCGDAGIEGFTRSGITYQCYFPDKSYSDNEYYNHIRNKATADIEKLKTNIERLKNFGVTNITEWHFVIPEYRDPRILTHLHKKKLEIINLKNSDPSKYSIISNDFDIIIKTADDFSDEIYKYIIHDITENKVKIDFKREKNIDITKCDSEKVSNIKRKIKAIMNCDENDERFVTVVNGYITAYMYGIELLQKLNECWPALYQEIFDLMEASKNDVYLRTAMNTDRSINKQLFDKIMDEFVNSLKGIKSLSNSAIIELKQDIIAGWLADCYMEFKG